MLSDRMKCKNCLFWDKDFGECRRNTPSLILALGSVGANEPANDPLKAVWPQTDKDEWCGEFVNSVSLKGIESCEIEKRSP